MNLNKMFVFVLVFFGFFSIFLATMPTEFISLGVTSEIQDKEAADYFSAHNVTMYNYTLSINLTKGSAESDDFGLPEGQKMEFWWDTEYLLGDAFELRHLTWEWWWWAMHRLEVDEPYANSVLWPSVGLTKPDLLALFDDDKNASYSEFSCEHIATKVFILTHNQSWTLAESWDNGKLKIYTSYDIDWSKTGTSMWTVITQIMTFRNPDLGIPGTFGLILGYGLSLALWGSIAILVLAAISALIPFVPGWPGGG